MRFEDLDVWKKSSRLTAAVYKDLTNLKDWGFRDQITRSALSVPSNIAEGIERNTPKECINFLGYAKGSCGELKTQIYIGIEIKYIAQETGHKWIEETKEISAMLTGLIKAKKKQAAP